jgi:hypothetical protein
MLILTCGWPFWISDILGVGRPGCDSREAKVWVLYNTEMEKKNDTILQNSVWLMIVTATSVGYGETYTTTLIGRGVAVLCGFWGVVLNALMTGSLSQLLQWTNMEMTGQKLVRRQRLDLRLRAIAVAMIERWWFDLRKKRHARKKWGVLKCFAPEHSRAKQEHLFHELRVCRQDRERDLDEFSGMSHKLDVIGSKFAQMEDHIEVIAWDLMSNEVYHSSGLHWDQWAEARIRGDLYAASELQRKSDDAKVERAGRGHEQVRKALNGATGTSSLHASPSLEPNKQPRPPGPPQQQMILAQKLKDHTRGKSPEHL